MATDSAEDHLLNRFGGIEYARWLLNLIKKGEGEKNEDAHKEAGINARKNTGFQLKAGALVFIASICSVGKVISSEPQPNGDRLYKLKVGYKERSFFGSYLELIRGGVQLWCLSCNTDEIAPRHRGLSNLRPAPCPQQRISSRIARCRNVYKRNPTVFT